MCVVGGKTRAEGNVGQEVRGKRGVFGACVGVCIRVWAVWGYAGAGQWG